MFPSKNSKGTLSTSVNLNSDTIELTTHKFRIDRIVTSDFEGSTSQQYRIQIGILFVRIYGSSGDTFSDDDEYSDRITTNPTYEHYINSGTDFYVIPLQL